MTKQTYEKALHEMAKAMNKQTQVFAQHVLAAKRASYPHGYVYDINTIILDINKGTRLLENRLKRSDHDQPKSKPAKAANPSTE